jgi:threonine dehydratase
MSEALISAAAIAEAHGRITAHVHRTRVFTCEALNQRASAAAGSEKQLFLKAEHEQRVGAFKIRGAVNSISLSRAEHVVTQSSGNHAQAIALGCKLLGKRAIVVMPNNSPSVKVNAVRETYGGEVRFCEPTQEAREAMSAEIVTALQKEHGEEKAEEIHPNQDVRVINGQGTVAKEFLEQQGDIDAIVASIGGGGLISGIATYAKHVNPAIKIIGAEPMAAKSAYMSKKAGKLVTNPPNTPVVSIADSVKSSLGPTSYPIVDKLVDDVFIVSEQEIEDATKFVLERSKQVIEPGCGVAVAVAVSKEFHDKYPDLKKIGVVMCGGNLDLDNLPWVASKRRKLDS